MTDAADRISWLNGWPWPGGEHCSILLGPSVHCIGCGRYQGITTVAIDDEWPPPDATNPDWPFPEGDCPICWLWEHWEPRREEQPWPPGKARPLP